MTVETDELSSAKRRLIFRDAVTFLGLILVTAVLLAITLFLFRSFTAHRAELAQRWSGRGQNALNQGHPEEAIVALRTALSYAPDENSYELLLAQALGDAGHLDESYNYFLGLWDAEPGNGFINLRLARLAAKKRDTQAAINSYHAAIYGTWEGDESDLTRVDPATGEVLVRLDMPSGAGVSGLESDGGDTFFCGGGTSGKVRAVKRPRHST